MQELKKQPKFGGYKPKSLRYGNSQAIINMFFKHDELSVRDISDNTGLSRTSVNNIVNSLVDKGFLVASGKGASTDEGGKKPELYSLNAERNYCISILFGGTMCTGKLIDLKLNIKQTSTIKSKVPMSEQQLIAALVQMINELIKLEDITSELIYSIVLQCGGIIDSKLQKLIVPLQNYHWGSDFAVKQLLVDALPFTVPVYLDNNSRFNGYYELLRDDSRKDRRIMVISTFSSGVGGCIINKGHLMHGANGFIGEVGHITTDYSSNIKCNCGNYGCFENTISIQTILHKAAKLLADYPDSTLSEDIHGNTLSLETMFDEADKGDSLACTLLDNLIQSFAVLIYNTRLLCDPDEIIIKELYAYPCTYFRNELRKKIFTNPFYSVATHSSLTFAPSDGFDSTHIGAALYCCNRFLGTDSTYF